jgi:hypothetical protein
LKSIRPKLNHIAAKMASTPWFFPLMLLVVGAFSYLLQVTRLGYYWDDWQAVYLWRAKSPAMIWTYFNYDRPFSAWTYWLTYPLLGMRAPLWQIFTYLLRWSGVWLLYKVLLALWPAWKRQWMWTALLLLTYAGFTVQSPSVAFNQHFITFMLFALSMALMVWAWQRRRLTWLLFPMAVIACALHLFTMEYFVGLEILRPVVLWLLAKKQKMGTGKTLRTIFLWWLPFLLVLCAFLWWRGVYYPSHTPNKDLNMPVLVEQLRQAPIQALSTLAGNIFQDVAHSVVTLWTGLFDISNYDFHSSSILLSWTVGILFAICAVFFISKVKIEPEDVTTQKFIWEILPFGILAILAGGLPVWVVGLQIVQGKWSSRFTLGVMLGAVILVVWLVEWLVRTRRQKNIILALLLAFSIATQVQMTNKYRLDWMYQRDFYWQLAWRAPGLKPGTAVFSASIPFGMESDYGIGFALNVLYHPQDATEQADYWFFTPRAEGFNFYKLVPGYPIDYQFRNVNFNGNTSQAIAVYYNPGQGCLRLLDDQYAADPTIPAAAAKMAVVSNPAQIESSGQPPLKEVFGVEPPHTWCYTFQKADLARQQQDWAQVIKLADAAGIHPQNGVEVLPFLEAYAHTGQWQQALAVSKLAVQTTPGLETWVCGQWKRLASKTGTGTEIQKQALILFACSQ